MTDTKYPRHERINVCAVCGEGSEEHHDFISTTVILPLWCKCDPYDWKDASKVPEVCGSFAGDMERCGECSHLVECHA